MAQTPKIVSLSGIFDHTYSACRGEAVVSALSTAKRRDLYSCLEVASGREVIVLSFPPKALYRRTGRWLEPLETQFFSHRQLFCGNWDGPKIRVPLSWFFFSMHVLRHVRSGDIVILDNYEMGFVIGAWILRLFRRVSFVLEYEDGRHLIDHGVQGVLSRLAELMGRPLIEGAFLVHPGLKARLPRSVYCELVPGFVVPSALTARYDTMNPVRFLYTGSLDSPRGVEMLMRCLDHLPEDGWELGITGSGPLAAHVTNVARDPKWGGKVSFYGVLPKEEFESLVAKSHVGLNCQLSEDPISAVTFPSKIFSYLSSGLTVLSSRASESFSICGNACLYFDEETPESLAEAMRSIILDQGLARSRIDTSGILDKYSLGGAAARLKRVLDAVLKIK